jgi:hypothetical protein
VGGRNAEVRLFDVAGRPSVVAKLYPAEDRAYPRLAAEARALTRLRRAGFAQVPELLASDATRGVAWLRYLPGDRAKSTPNNLRQMADFLIRLNGLHRQCPREAVGWAADAAPSLMESAQRVHQRRRALDLACARHPALAAFMREALDPALDEVLGNLGRLGGAATRRRRPQELTLSPSDFGLHNALQSPNDGLCFFDFEYFGLDDSAKMIADFLLHPSAFAGGLRARWPLAEACLEAFVDDDDLRRRIRAQLPLQRVKWCLLVLNEFHPGVVKRRRRAGVVKPGALRRCQAQKLWQARALLARSASELASIPDSQ